MPNIPKQDWLDHQALLEDHLIAMRDFVEEYEDEGENPLPPLPPKPPLFTGWLGEHE